MEDKPKPRPITLSVTILNYLGDYIAMLEKGVENIANQELIKINDAKRKKISKN
jgi:hypothetical protein